MACPSCGAANVGAGQACPVCGAGAMAALPELDLKRRPSSATAKAPAAPPKAVGGRELDLEEGSAALPELGVSRAGIGGALGGGALGAGSSGEIDPDEDDFGPSIQLELAAVPSSQAQVSAPPAPMTPSGGLPTPVSSSGRLSGAAPAPRSSGSLPAARPSGAMPAASPVPAAPVPAAPVPATPPPDDPAARLAGHGPPPKHFWETPIYAFRVLMRLRELKGELEAARSSRSNRTPLYEAALHAHDQKAVTTGLALSAGVFLLLTVLFFMPVIVRFVRLAQD